MLTRPALLRLKREPHYLRMRQCGMSKLIVSWGGPLDAVQQKRRLGGVRAAKDLELATR
jgi:hypothetical protein